MSNKSDLTALDTRHAVVNDSVVTGTPSTVPLGGLNLLEALNRRLNSGVSIHEVLLEGILAACELLNGLRADLLRTCGEAGYEVVLCSGIIKRVPLDAAVAQYIQELAAQVAGANTIHLLDAELNSALSVLLERDDGLGSWVARVQSGDLLLGFLLISAPTDKKWRRRDTHTLDDLMHVLSSVLVAAQAKDDKKQVEKALRRANRRLTNVLQSVTDAYFALDRDWRFSYVNPQAEIMTGRNRSDLLGRIIWDVFPEKLKMQFHSEYQKAMHHHTAVSFREYYADTNRWFQIKAYPSQDGLAVYIQDITVQVLAEDAHRLDSARLHRSMEGVVRALSFAVEVRDPYTSAHQRRVGALAGAISRELGDDQEQVIQIQVAGLLHDVGKISVPSEIMTRPGKLTTAEMAIIRTHPEIGFNMLRGIEFDSPVALVALQHHERLDGSGYPQGLRDNEIIKESRIMAVADVVEAMASHRPYRPALGIEPALDEILCNRARLYDADCVDACFRVFTKCGFDFDHLLLDEPILYPSS